MTSRNEQTSIMPGSMPANVRNVMNVGNERDAFTERRRVRGLNPWLLCLAAAATTQVIGMDQALAWNPFKSAGSSFGKGVAASALPAAEDVGHRLIADVNGKLAQRLEQVQDTLNGTTEKLDILTQERLQDANQILAARITQIGGVANGAIGNLDRVAERRIHQLEQSGSRLISQLSDAETKALNDADRILEDRIGQLDDVVGRSLDNVDAILQARIEQLDELSERRLGNADVIATQQGVAVESSLLKVGQVVALLAFIVYVVIKTFQDFTSYWKAHLEADRAVTKVRNTALTVGKALGWVAVRVLVAAVCFLVIQHLSKSIAGSQVRLETLLAQTRADFIASSKSLDFGRVRFYESQLQLLETDRPKRDAYRRESRKYELARSVLGRAALLKSPQSAQELVQQLRALRVTGQDDADLLALESYVNFRSSQNSETRELEPRAAELAAKALTADPSATATFTPLAASVLTALVEDPVPGSSVAHNLTAYRAQLQAFGDVEFLPINQAVAYDRAVAALNRASSSGFIALVKAHAASKNARKPLNSKQLAPFESRVKLALDPTRLDPALEALAIPDSKLDDAQLLLARALTERLRAAEQVIAAWKSLDDALRSDQRLADSPTIFTAFSLNDAVLTQALWVRRNPNAVDLAGPLKAIVPWNVRLDVTPVRVEWARRYTGSFNRATSLMFGFQEAHRYEAFEAQVQDFVVAFVKIQVSQGTPPPPSKSPEMPRVSPTLQAALAASELGLYGGEAGARKAFGLELLGERPSEDERALVVERYSKRHLTFL